MKTFENLWWIELWDQSSISHSLWNRVLAYDPDQCNFNLDQEKSDASI